MVEISSLIEPDSLTTSLAILMMALQGMFAYFIVRFRHALLAVTWFASLVVIGLIVLVSLEFLWYWIMVMVMAAIVGLAGVFRYFVLPARGQSG